MQKLNTTSTKKFGDEAIPQVSSSSCGGKKRGKTSGHLDCPGALFVESDFMLGPTSLLLNQVAELVNPILIPN